MLKSHCSSHLVLQDKICTVNLVIILEENVFRNIEQSRSSMYFLCIFVLLYFFYVLGKRDNKNKRKVI